MFPVLRAVLCELFGHSWQDPEIILWIKGRYRVTCQRCHLTIEGGWQAIEDAGAWRHYR